MRDRELLDVLALRVRVLSVAQVARTWFRATVDPVHNADRRLRTLVAIGAVERFTMAARPELTLANPLVRWAPEQPPPDFDHLSYRLEVRWREPAVPTPLVIASRAAGSWLGGVGGRRPRRSEVSHDITLAGVYLRRVAADPAVRAHWLSEGRLGRLGYGDRARLPDALIERNGVRTAIELGGAYSARKLAAFHAFCEEQRLFYELW